MSAMLPPRSTGMIAALRSLIAASILRASIWKVSRIGIDNHRQSAHIDFERTRRLVNGLGPAFFSRCKEMEAASCADPDPNDRTMLVAVVLHSATGAPQCLLR